MHYSINIQGKPINGSFTWSNTYKFKNPYITMMKVLIKPYGQSSIFKNVDKTNIFRNSKGESITLDPGYYSLSEIMAQLNTMQYTEFSISNSIHGFGCTFVQSSADLDFKDAPDIMEILGFTETFYKAAPYYSKNIIDITRNRQAIQVYSSLVRSSDLKISNQNNNILTTIIVNDPQSEYINTVEDINIPMSTRFDNVYFSFKDMDGNMMKLDAEFELQLTVDDEVTNSVDKTGSAASLSQFSLTQVCNKSKTVKHLDNPLNFKNCYISSISLYTDIRLFNVPEDQKVVINGNVDDYCEVIIPQGAYELEELIAMLNCSDAQFEVVYECENAFRTCIKYFYSISFKEAEIVKKILGIESSVLQRLQSERTYEIKDSNNTIVINCNNSNKSFTLKNGWYTWESFLNMLIDTIKTTIDYVRTETYDTYIRIISNNYFYFNRASTTSTIHNFFLMKWYNLQSDIETNVLELPDFDETTETNDNIYIEPNLFASYQDTTKLGELEYFYQEECVCSYNIYLSDSSQLYSGTVVLQGEFNSHTMMDYLVDQINTAFNNTSYHPQTSILSTEINSTFNYKQWQTISTHRLSLSFDSNLKIGYWEGPTKGNFCPKTNGLSRDTMKFLSVTLIEPVKVSWSLGDDNTNTLTIPAGSYTSIQIPQLIKNAFGNSYTVRRNPNGVWTVICNNNTIPAINIDHKYGFNLFNNGKNLRGITFGPYKNSVCKDMNDYVQVECKREETRTLPEVTIVFDVLGSRGDNTVKNPDEVFTIPAGDYTLTSFANLLKNKLNSYAKTTMKYYTGYIENNVYVYGFNDAIPGFVFKSCNIPDLIPLGAYYSKGWDGNWDISKKKVIMLTWKKTETIPINKNTIHSKIVSLITLIISSAKVLSNHIFSYIFKTPVQFNWIGSTSPHFTQGYVSSLQQQSLNYLNFKDYYYRVNIGGKNNLTFTLNNVSTTMTLTNGYQSQKELVDMMNTVFKQNGLDIQWEVGDEYYYIAYIDRFKLTGNFMDSTFWYPIEEIYGSDRKVYIWKYSDKRFVTNTNPYYSNYPVDITNGIANIQLYCNIVKSKTKPLLTNIPLESLFKNYYYKNRIVIPCSDQLDRLEYEFRDENDQPLSFLGNIYLLLTFTIEN